MCSLREAATKAWCTRRGPAVLSMNRSMVVGMARFADGTALCSVLPKLKFRFFEIFFLKNRAVFLTELDLEAESQCDWLSVLWWL